MSEFNTLCGLFFVNLESYDKPDVLMRRSGGEWKSVSTKEVGEAVEEISLGLQSLGVKKGDKVLLLSENRPEWLLCDYAILTAGAATVPVYPTLHAKDTAYVADNSEAVVAFVSNGEQLEKILSRRTSIANLRDLVIFDEPPGDSVEGCITIDELRRRGRDKKKENPSLHRDIAMAVEPDDLASIVYTSGTTGEPKGVMLTHNNFVSNVKGGIKRISVTEADQVLSFLPLSHVFERMVDYCFFLKGCSIAYAEGVEQLVDNMGEVHPTVVPAVPRLFEKAYGKLMDQAALAGGLKKNLIHWSVKVFQDWTEADLEGGGAGFGLRCKHAVADKLVGSKLRTRMGGRLRFFVSGGAPLARDLGLFFHGAGIPIVEGYGLTETAPIITVNYEHKPKYGSIGPALEGVEVKIAEDGELWARGPNIMKGYFKKPEATEEVMTPDGWFKTGDIGTCDDEGYYYITDRKKELLVTASGKNVAPQPIENVLKMNKYVAMAMLVGDRKPYITALISPNWENLYVYAESKGVETRDHKELCAHPQIRHLFKHVLERLNVKLSRFEQVKRCRLIPREFTMDDGELTPTMKFKRRVILEHFHDVIEEMYAVKKDESEC